MTNHQMPTEISMFDLQYQMRSQKATSKSKRIFVYLQLCSSTIPSTPLCNPVGHMTNFNSSIFYIGLKSASVL